MSIMINEKFGSFKKANLILMSLSKSWRGYTLLGKLEKELSLGAHTVYNFPWRNLNLNVTTLSIINTILIHSKLGLNSYMINNGNL